MFIIIIIIIFFFLLGNHLWIYNQNYVLSSAISQSTMLESRHL